VIVIFSDHGLHMGIKSLTKYGEIDSRLPLLHILMPQEYINDNMTYYLLSNQQQLFSFYDLRKSLISLIDESYNDKFINIFKEIISSNRTCREAKIPLSICPCTIKK